MCCLPPAVNDADAHRLLACTCRGKPLTGVEAAPAAAAGRMWCRPSAVVAIKTAALRTLCQALVPDNPKAQVSQVWGAGLG